MSGQLEIEETIRHIKEKAYSYRSFEHFKRETFSIIASIAERIKGPIRMADISCGPAVLEGILLSKFGKKIQEVHLLDIERGFLSVAREYLEDLKPDLATHVFDLNAPDDYPTIPDLNLIVSTNAICHATSDSLQRLYRWCHASLQEDGMLINQQTFGPFCKDFDQELLTQCALLHNKGVLDNLDAELNRRSHLDTQRSGDPGYAAKAGGYAGLSMSVFEHLEILRSTGFVADEIWRKGTSAMILALKEGL
ncbi:MAG: class I SAM-dependent methyltransferase [Planctomycetota bacterium]